MSGEERQRAAPYPANFIVAVKPGDVNTAGCEHEGATPVCACVHDWRIEWKNMPKRSVRRAAYVTDAP